MAAARAEAQARAEREAAARAERARREEEAARREAEERAKRAAEERALREAEEAAAAAAAVAAAEEAEARAAMEAEERARAAEAARRAALVALHGPSPGLCECSWADLGVAEKSAAVRAGYTQGAWDTELLLAPPPPPPERPDSRAGGGLGGLGDLGADLPAATQSTPSLVSRGDAAASSSHDASSPSLPPLSSASPPRRESRFDPAAAPTFDWVPPLPPATPPRSKKRRVKRRSDGRAKAWKEAQAFNGRPVTLPPVRNGTTAAGSPRTSPRGSQERRPKASPYESALAPPKLSSQQLSTTLRNYWAARPLSPTPTKATPPKMKVYHVVYY